MSKSLAELFAILANADAPAPTPDKYRATMSAARAKVSNAGNSEGVKRAWETRKGGPAATAQAIRKQGGLRISKVGRNTWEGNTPHNTDFAIRKENGDHIVDIFDSKQKNPDKAYLASLDGHKNPQEAAAAAHEWSRDYRAGKTKSAKEGKLVFNSRMFNGGEGSGQRGHHPDHPPISNVQGNWMYHPEGESYSSEASSLEHSGRHDPWGRPLIMRYMKQHTNEDNEATHWSGTIQAPPATPGTLGKAAKLTIFND